VLQPYFKSSEGISCTSLHCSVLTRFAIDLFPYESLNARKQKNTTNKLLTRKKFQNFLNQAPYLFFKNLIVSTPLLLQGLHRMSLLKSVPEGLKPQECDRTKLHEPPPVPYIPSKDEVQEEVEKLRNLKIKTTIEKDTTLNFLVWHENGIREAFLMNVTAVLDAIKKRGHLQDYKKAEKIHDEEKKPLSQPGLLYPCSTVPEQRPKGFCKKKAREAA
jgi:hypothetical protein